ncbi:hypothetical protein SERLADRAFT_476365 [Serpula lacrymans var. lacrymans S7.9]|uniref:Uncharacterized protein n=1 Tax=Serpula lacrymans var. lacrymans (strain S7.9) TaxID=578457 RepID=F8P7B1_SERL9|nr:uncharacterized protein SERLADRAFT_476365 [Serpula lacrymans var. lacrymans S7.9]EGO21327.1 hypothetical protein SERLADRAFT_476365 [Serpula lacrymans var. lacrymans S7.9]
MSAPIFPERRHYLMPLSHPSRSYLSRVVRRFKIHPSSIRARSIRVCYLYLLSHPSSLSMDNRLVSDNATSAYVPIVPSTAPAATQVRYVSGVAESTVVDISPVHSVSFSPAPHPAEPFPDRQLQTSCDEGPALALLRRACTRQHMRCGELLQTSLSESDPSIYDIIPQKNGFVHTVMEAYNRHRALIIRPDDVWLAILIQFSLYVNGNAELLGKKIREPRRKERFNYRYRWRSVLY